MYPTRSHRGIRGNIACESERFDLGPHNLAPAEATVAGLKPPNGAVIPLSLSREVCFPRPSARRTRVLTTALSLSTREIYLRTAPFHTSSGTKHVPARSTWVKLIRMNFQTLGRKAAMPLSSKVGWYTSEIATRPSGELLYEVHQALRRCEYAFTAQFNRSSLP